MLNLSFWNDRTRLQYIIHDYFLAFEVSVHVQCVLNQQVLIGVFMRSELLLNRHVQARLVTACFAYH
jgi:hypothetical protein